MQGEAYQVKAVLERHDVWKKIFLGLKDSPGNPFYRSQHYQSIQYLLYYFI